MNNDILSLKKNKVEELTDHLKEASAFIFFNFKKVNSNEITILRKKLFEQKINLQICKNNIFKRAIKNLGFSLTKFDLTQENAICFIKEKNFLPLIKNVYNFIKEKKLIIKTSVLEGQITEKEFIKQLSLVNSKKDIIAEFTFCLKFAINELALCLENIKK